MKQLKFYVDFDDILAETANRICEISKDMFGTTAVFDDIKDFDLKKSLNINQNQYEELMDMTHDDRLLATYLPIEGAQEAINFFASKGVIIDVVTGRPPYTLEASKLWLEKYGFIYNKIIFADKYGRFDGDDENVMTLDDIRKSDYDLMIDDAPIMLDFISKEMTTPIGVLQRPWNESWLAEQGSLTGRVLQGASWNELRDRIMEFFEGGLMTKD
jgi:uncharacterized HAD superfamily protein